MLALPAGRGEKAPFVSGFFPFLTQWDIVASLVFDVSAYEKKSWLTVSRSASSDAILNAPLLLACLLFSLVVLLRLRQY
jgi:hypothetical protein